VVLSLLLPGSVDELLLVDGSVELLVEGSVVLDDASLLLDEPPLLESAVELDPAVVSAVVLGPALLLESALVGASVSVAAVLEPSSVSTLVLTSSLHADRAMPNRSALRAEIRPSDRIARRYRKPRPWTTASSWPRRAGLPLLARRCHRGATSPTRARARPHGIGGASLICSTALPPAYA
jgi:hypothetical protein